MRHKVAGWKLGRNTAHRRALLRNLVTSLIVEERIETTVTKAKAMRPHVEKMITLGKRGDLAARRQAACLPHDRRSGREAVRHRRAPLRRPPGRLPAHHPHRMAQGRWRRQGLRRTARQRSGPGRKAQKRAEVRQKRAAEAKKAMEDAEQPQGGEVSGATEEDKK